MSKLGQGLPPRPRARSVSAQAYAMTVCERVRDLRTSQDLSLADVQRISNGRLTAASLGAYERGSRSLTVAALAEICDVYGAPVDEVLSGRAAAAVRAEAMADSLERIARELRSAGESPAPVAPVRFREAAS